MCKYIVGRCSANQWWQNFSIDFFFLGRRRAVTLQKRGCLANRTKGITFFDKSKLSLKIKVLFSSSSYGSGYYFELDMV